MTLLSKNLKSKKGYLFSALIIIIILIIILLSRCGCNNKNQYLNNDLNNNGNYNLNYNLNNNNNDNTNTNANGNQDNPWPDLSGCSTGMIVDYHSTAKATDETEVGEIFKEYISWAQMNNKEIFSGKGNKWQFQSAAPHGIYKNIKYWRITALWFSETKQQWLPQIIFDVNEESKVVRLLGCL